MTTNTKTEIHIETEQRPDGGFYAFAKSWPFSGCPMGRGKDSEAAQRDLIRRAAYDLTDEQLHSVAFHMEAWDGMPTDDEPDAKPGLDHQAALDVYSQAVQNSGNKPWPKDDTVDLLRRHFSCSKAEAEKMATWLGRAIFLESQLTPGKFIAVHLGTRGYSETTVNILGHATMNQH